MEKLVKTRIVWPTTNQKIGWSFTDGSSSQFEFEDTFEVVDEKGETTFVTRSRRKQIAIPFGGEIVVEGVTFQCRSLEERKAHHKWEVAILSGGKQMPSVARTGVFEPRNPDLS